jgi:hypothetical protein
MLLETLTANGVDASDGVALAGVTVHVGGAPVPQLSATRLAYPFRAVSIPLNCAEEFTDTVRDGLVILRM